MFALRLVSILIGGAAGAVSRYGLSRFVANAMVHTLFPWSTLVINSIGCLVIGFAVQLFDRVMVAPAVRDFLVIGFLGAFTTFSTFALETVNLLREREWGLGLWNLLASNLLGVVMVFAGVFIGRAVLNR
ncbi:fluoride efflux transporter CrcB [Salinispira pacifica]